MSEVRIYNKILCPSLWHNFQLDKEVRMNLLQIAKDFYEKTRFKAPVKDICLMGSSANFNWTPESDIDVHILIDFNQLRMPEDTAEKMAKTTASQWNLEHDIRVKGHKVELNFQNISDTKPHVTGIYSLVRNRWIRVPKRELPQVNKIAIVSKYTKLKNYIEKSIQSGEREYMKTVKEYIDAYRQYGLDSKGELSTENITFKLLRSRGILKNLKDAINKTYDQQMSIDETTDQIKNDYIGGVVQGEVRAEMVPLGKAKGAVHGDYKGLYSGQNNTNWRYFGNKNILIFNLEAEAGDVDKVKEFLRKRGIVDPMVKVMYRYEEGYGAGKPEDDRLHIPGHRWQIKSKDAPKTPKMTVEFINESAGEYKKGISSGKLDTIQSALDVAGIEPTIGTVADSINVVISLLRAAKDKTSDERKSHLFDAAISAISILPMADFVKILKIRKYRKLATKAARVIKTGGKNIPKSYDKVNNLQEMPQLSLKGKKAYADDVPLKTMPIEKVEENIVVFRNPHESFFGPAGTCYLYFMDSKESADAMKLNKIPMLIIPRGTFHSGGSPITDVWKKRFQKPGTEHILGLIEGIATEDIIYIDMISVRPGWQRNRVASLMMDALKDMFPKAKVQTSGTTDKGKKFFEKEPKLNDPTSEGFDPTSVGPNPAGTEGQTDPEYYKMQNAKMRRM